MSEHNKENMLFVCEEHKIFYYKSLKRVRQVDVYLTLSATALESAVIPDATLTVFMISPQAT